MTSRDEREACEHFRARYAVPATDVIERRAATEQVDERFAAVAAAGAHQPFHPGSFDAIVHTDGLC
jgi:hypothetical protein